MNKLAELQTQVLLSAPGSSAIEEPGSQPIFANSDGQSPLHVYMEK